MSIEKDGLSTESFWSRFALRHSLSTLTFVKYHPHPHGTLNDGGDYAYNDSTPLLQFLHSNKWPISANEVLAVGSLVFDEDLRPQSLLMFDLDCPKSVENFIRIQETLDRNKIYGYSIYETKHSYHLILDATISVNELPIYYGEFVKMFADSEILEADYIYFQEIGSLLINNFNDIEKLEFIAHKLLHEIQHYDEHEPTKRKFIIDLRWIAHSLLEFIKYLNTENCSFAFLRVSGSEEDENQPQLIATNRVYRKFNGEIYLNSLDD